jgi:hypothetical protein
MTIPVLLMECPIAGFQYHEGESCWKELRTGQALGLVREPGNRHDARAVRVHWRDAILGYVPRDANFMVAQMLDRGERIEGRISLLRESGDPWQRVTMQVILGADASRVLPTLVERAAHKRPESVPPRKSPTTSTLPKSYIVADLEALLVKDLKAWMLAKKVIKQAAGQ